MRVKDGKIEMGEPRCARTVGYVLRCALTIYLKLNKLVTFLVVKYPAAELRGIQFSKKLSSPLMPACAKPLRRRQGEGLRWG